MTVLVNPYRFASVSLTTLFYDEFTDTNGTALTAHTPDTDTVGGGWLAGAAELAVQSNKAYGDANTGEQNWADVSQSDVTLTAIATVQAATTSGSGVIGRVTDESNFWIARITTASHTIFEKNAGGYTSRATSASARSTATNYTIKFVLSGTSLVSTVDDADEISYSSSTFQTNTKHGIRVSGNNSTGGDLDNFRIEA